MIISYKDMIIRNLLSQSLRTYIIKTLFFLQAPLYYTEIYEPLRLIFGLTEAKSV